MLKLLLTSLCLSLSITKLSSSGLIYGFDPLSLFGTLLCRNASNSISWLFSSGSSSTCCLCFAISSRISCLICSRTYKTKMLFSHASSQSTSIWLALVERCLVSVVIRKISQQSSTQWSYLRLAAWQSIQISRQTAIAQYRTYASKEDDGTNS